MHSWDNTIWKTFDNCSMDKNYCIFVYWQFDKIHLQVVNFSDQFVHCSFATADGKWEGYVTYIYAHNSVEKRKSLWKSLVTIAQSMDSPWVLLGDFNVVLDSSEKLSDTGSPLLVSDELASLLLATDLHDHKYIGNKYTWDNGHTWCKLDRALCNGFWSLSILVLLWNFFQKVSQITLLLWL